MGFNVQDHILQENFQVLKKHHPGLLSQLSSAEISPMGEVVVSGEKDLPNLKIMVNGKPVLLHPEQDPEADQHYFLSRIRVDFSGVEILFGMGLGYGVKSLLQQRQDIRNLVILEPEPGILLQALRYMDLTDLLKDPRVILGIDPEDPDVFLAAVQKGIAFEDTQFLEHPVIVQCFSERYKPLLERIYKHVNRYNIAGATKMKFGKKIVRNRFDHLKSLGHYFRFESLMDQFKDVPAYIAAGGPSLEADIGFLKQVQDRAVIICVDSVLPVFLDNGIIPDFVTCIDYQDITYEKFAHKVNEIPDSIALLNYTSTNPVVQKNFPGVRKFFLFSEEGIDHWINTLVHGNHFFSSGPSVANLNFIAARVMGCSPIVFVGQDLCYNYKKSHTKDVMLTAQDWTEEHLKTGKGLSWIKGVEGEDVPATRDLINIMNFFESLIHHNPGEYINCSTGGAHIEGTRYLPLAQAVDIYYSDTTRTSKVLGDICSPQNTINPGLIAEQLKNDLSVVEPILALIRKVDRLLKKCRAEIPGIVKKWKRNPVLPPKIKTLLTDIDTINNRIDSHDQVWRILEDLTSKALRKSEQMVFEAGKLKGIVHKYPEWLEKSVDRLVFVNTIRMDAIEFLVQGIKEVITHITAEKRLLEQNCDDMETIRNLAALYVESEDYSLARPFIEKYYNVNSDSAQANFLMGCLNAQLRRIDTMDDCFIKASHSDPEYEIQINKYRYRIGHYYFDSAVDYKQYDLQVTKGLLLKGLRFCPFHKKIRNMITEIADEDVNLFNQADAGGILHEHESVIQNWLETIKNYPQVQSCLSSENLGIVYYYWGKIKFTSDQREEALVQFRKSMAYLPEDAGLLLKIADLFLCSFDYEEGIPWLNKAIDMDVGSATYWEGFGDFLFKHNQFDEALSAYEQMLQYFPQKSEIREKVVQCWLQKGNRLHGDGDFQMAEIAYNQGLQLCAENSPSLVHLYNNLGSTLQNREEFELALSAYDRALEIDADYAEALHNKGVLLNALGETERATQLLLRAKSLSSKL